MRLTYGELALLAMLTGCGGSSGARAPDGGGGTPDAQMAAATATLLPLAIGNTWTYKVTNTDGTFSSEVVFVAAQEPVGGDGPNSTTMAFRLVTGQKAGDPDGDLSWQAEVGSRVVEYRAESVGESKGNEKNESSWDPPRLRVDETPAHTAEGASWNEPPYTEQDTDVDTSADAGSYIPDGGLKSIETEDTWTVVAASQSVTVPAGTFDALVLRRARVQGGSSVKNYWFAPGVGLIRQSEENHATHELASYKILSP